MNLTMDGASASPPLRELTLRLAAHERFRAAALELCAGQRVALEPVVGGARAFCLAALEKLCPRPLLVVLPTLVELERLEDEFSLFSDAPVEVFPPWEVEPQARRPSDPVFGRRRRILKKLAAGVDRVVLLSTFGALQQRVLSRTDAMLPIEQLAVGRTCDLEKLRRRLLEHGYQHVTAVAAPGEFSCRGGIWDVFSADALYPVRIEWFGDEVDSLRQFDLHTQRTVAVVDTYEISSGLVGEDSAKSSLVDYLPDNTVCVFIEPESLHREAVALFEQSRDVEELLRPEEVFAPLEKFPQVEMSVISTSGAGRAVRLPLETVERFSGEVGRVAEELDRTAQDHRVWLVVETQAERDRLYELFESTQLAQQQRLGFLIGRLYQGFRFRTEQTIVLSGAELFQRTQLRRRPVTGRPARPADGYTDLQPGDLVVHVTYGIGRYRGLELVERDGGVQEHLVLEFADDVRIYVPATRIYLVHKYVGGTQRRPRLARLGSRTWVKQKEAAQRAVMRLAVEMLELQAHRMAHPGHACGPDSLWQHEFDAAFPYAETPDQLEAIAAIKRDMESPRPMDRLLCGDVGFGKTEVAMRAAFKAVDNGYQVALIAPTTVLVEQHYQTFRERMAEFPVTIGRLSRFCTSAEERRILQGLASGGVDIVIGTHRLASGDVKFRNLGLLIIDEEQRFGVRIKEYLKSLRANVDVLTLSATPIPRTLHMALVGVRDISNLQTPPQDRWAVETEVLRWDDEVIRHAVLRELNRHGQIFFVHNCIQEIPKVAKKLRSLVPEARIGIAHAQLPEEELEQVMVDFVQHRFDLLLCTTIVENGLDIPNANTIFVSPAQRYGLADLHQLRGRVGRYKHKAYCYLLIDPRGNLTPNATRRLLAITEFQELGAGFSIAMRDLEIRGAGNLLGTEQSGHIAAVGYELYCQLLENAVRVLKNLPPKSVWDVEIRLPIEAYLPADYVEDSRTRMELYRRLARVSELSELEAIGEELRDRFGPWPAPVQGLFRLVKLRHWAASWAVQAIYVEDNALVLRYSDQSQRQQWKRQRAPAARLVGDDLAYVPLGKRHATDGQIIRLAETLLQPETGAPYNGHPAGERESADPVQLRKQ
ncbi:MAG: transcription-repair-coupling factor [Pirellulaceae bacterium]|nr:MAG: transcription-repair-coupling factor [Pirellulaceae bacterium]